MFSHCSSNDSLFLQKVLWLVKNILPGKFDHITGQCGKKLVLGPVYMCVCVCVCVCM